MATLNPPILASDIDAKSPVDETLMGAIKSNLENIQDQIGAAVSSNPVSFRVNGPLSALPSGRAKRIDTAHFGLNQTLSYCKLYLDQPGTSGTLQCDLRKLYRAEVPITGIEQVFSASTAGIAQTLSGVAIQSITRTVPAISIQSITWWKPVLNIQSIVNVGTAPGGNYYYQINLDQAPDSDWQIEDRILIAGATVTSWNGLETFYRKNDYGSKSLTVISPSTGLDQLGAGGTVTLKAWAYNFTNPVSSHFAAGEKVTFSGTTSNYNAGIWTIFAVNSGGNNIVVKKEYLANELYASTQAGAAGQALGHRYTVTFSSAASSDFAVGEDAKISGVSNAFFNGTWPIKAVNSGGNNVIIAWQYQNYSTADQTSPSGTAGTLRWTYSLSANPSGLVSVGESVYFSGHSDVYNNGTFTVVQVNRSGLNNVVIYNGGGSTAGSGGTVTSVKKKIKFASDASSLFKVGDYIEIEGAQSSIYNTIATSNLGYQVKAINFGGGANYNVIVEQAGAYTQSVPMGWVSVISRSLFSTCPAVTISPTINSIGGTYGQGQVRQETTAAVFNSEATLEAGVLVGLYVLQVPTGADTFSLLVR